MAVDFYVPSNVPGPSGGTNYNSAVARGLRARGVPVVVHPVAGAWPRPSPWEGPGGGGVAVVDGLIGSACPEAIARAGAGGARVHVLVHMALPSDPAWSDRERAGVREREARALRAAAGVITTSHWSAADLHRRYGLAGVEVISPGVEPAPVARGSFPPRILCLGALTPAKNQLTLLRALKMIQDLPWQAHLVGSHDHDPAYAARVRAEAATMAPQRVRVPGPQEGEELTLTWQGTDLLVLCSATETFGLVVTEALARGVPALVSQGTGAEEALGSRPLAGGAVDGRDPGAIAASLRQWLTRRSLRRDWREAALIRRTALPTWGEAADRWRALLGDPGAGARGA